MARVPAGSDFDGWVRLLGIAHARQHAKRHLLAAGPAALPALRRGLGDRNPVVRQFCVALLDHLVDEDAIPDLIAALDDEDPVVCARALHALACDACKQNECRPGDDAFVPRAFELLRDHPDTTVRAAAINALGQVGRRRPDVAAALAIAGDGEPDSGLRRMAQRRVQRLIRYGG
ncbi:MAG TPA: HEAT repeat domain-containing protein [Acidimicrobiia bacterium]|nr:HEAT repeat domain-containing protein [Acidimicrobiia bacterium]